MVFDVITLDPGLEPRNRTGAGLGVIVIGTTFALGRCYEPGLTHTTITTGTRS